MIFFNSVLTVYWLSTFLDLKLCQKYFNKVRKVFFYSWKFLSLHIVGRIRIRVSKSFDSDPGYFDSDPLPTVHLLDPPLLISVTSTSSSNYWVTGTVGKEQGMNLRGSGYSVVHGKWRACSSYSFSWPYSMCKKLATLRDFRNLGVCLHMLSALVLVLDSPTCMIPSCLASTVSLAGEGVSTLQQLLAMARQKGGVDQGQHFIHTILQLEAEGAEEERRRGGQAAERTRPAVQTLQMKFKSAEQGTVPPTVYSPLLSTVLTRTCHSWAQRRRKAQNPYMGSTPSLTPTTPIVRVCVLCTHATVYCTVYMFSSYYCT